MNSVAEAQSQRMSKLAVIAMRNLLHYLKYASFKCEADRTAALNCHEVIALELDNLADRIEALERVDGEGGVKS